MRKKSNKGLSLKLLALVAVGGSVMTSGCVVYLPTPFYGPGYGQGYGIHVYPYIRPYRGRDGRDYYRHRHPNGYYYWSLSPKPKPQYKGEKPKRPGKEAQKNKRDKKDVQGHKPPVRKNRRK